MPNLHTLIRVHVNPRSELLLPTSENYPIPLDWLDMYRTTETSLDYGQLREIEDFGSVDARNEPTRKWTGRSVFQIVPTHPEPGKE